MRYAPKIVARLKTDAAGRPMILERSGQRHYQVVFEIADAPPDAYAATFELDPSYYDSVRSVLPSSEGKLQLATSTYGDYELMVRLQTKEGELRLSDSVSNALRRGLTSSASSPTPAIEEALSDIGEH
jgi:hypothetical protein